MQWGQDAQSHNMIYVMKNALQTGTAQVINNAASVGVEIGALAQNQVSIEYHGTIPH